ncbi:MAG TPA: DUF6089 family protein [Saprospiraceae bacterium]|nr:DUF6089 family protein [Saprospiraceae bacterium]HMP23819.1 DUF6089 family protein [Saprospiraceae bacterium]
MKKLLIVTLLVGISAFATAQKGWEAGGWLGASWYFGDLNTNYNLSMPGLAGGIIGRYNFNNRLAMKFSGNMGMVMADDALSNNSFERARNLSFRSRIIEGAAQLEFNFMPYTHGSREEFFTPYLFGGLNVFHFNPEAEYQGEWVELRPLGTEGQFKGEEYFSVSAGLVYGFGFKIDLSYEWSINIELGARTLFTDYIDDVSGSYPDISTLRRSRGELAAALSDRSIPVPGVNEGKIGEAGRQRGSTNINDSYVMLGVGIVYYFGDLRCPGYGKRRRL